MMLKAAGIRARGGAELAAVLGSGRRFVTPSDIARALGVDADTAAKKLARWAEDGWGRRGRRGLYIVVRRRAGGCSRGVEPLLLHGLDGGAALGAHRAGLSHDGAQDLRAGPGR